VCFGAKPGVPSAKFSASSNSRDVSDFFFFSLVIGCNLQKYGKCGFLNNLIDAICRCGLVNLLQWRVPNADRMSSMNYEISKFRYPEASMQFWLVSLKDPKDPRDSKSIRDVERHPNEISRCLSRSVRVDRFRIQNLISPRTPASIRDAYDMWNVEMSKSSLNSHLKQSRDVHLPVTLCLQVLCILPENSSRPMMAYMMMTKRTNKAICKSGTIALRIEFRTTWRPTQISSSIS